MTHVSFQRPSLSPSQSWADATNVIVGAFFAASPMFGLGGSPAIHWNAVVCGLLVIAVSAVGVLKPSRGAEWTNIGLGVWILVAPWALGYAAQVGATSASVMVGLTVACFAAAQLSLLKR